MWGFTPKYSNGGRDILFGEWPSNAIWRQRSGSTLAPVMACCLMTPGHYLDQHSLIISKDHWHSSEDNFTRYIRHQTLKFHSNLPGANELTHGGLKKMANILQVTFKCRRQAITWAAVDQDLWRHIASLGHKECFCYGQYKTIQSLIVWAASITWGIVEYHKCHNAPVPCPTMHHSEQNTNVHISLLNDALWDIGQVHCGICDTVLFSGTIWYFVSANLIQWDMDSFPLQWHHNKRDDVSNYWCLNCLLKCLFRRRSKKTSKLHVTGLWEGKPPVTGGFPSQMASNMENVSIPWCHHANLKMYMDGELHHILFLD